MAEKRMNWGMIGAGVIVQKFAQGLLGMEDANVYGVVNRSRERAEQFADEVQEQKPDRQRPKVYADLAEMLEDPSIDAVYIGVTNELHAPYMKECILHGKPVLCEKPFTLNADEAREVAELAREKGVFCMEAMWSGFLPAWNQVKEEIRNGSIGEIQSINANFGFCVPEVEPEHRLFDLKKGGGALLDVGVYVAYFIMDFMGRKPDEVRSTAVIGSTGVDEANEMQLIYREESSDGAGDTGRTVVCYAASAMRKDLGENGVICGTRGKYEFPRHYASQIVEVTTWTDGEPEGKTEHRRIECPFQVNGYEYEAEEVMDCIRNGRLESERHPLSKTIEVMEVLDEARKCWK